MEVTIHGLNVRVSEPLESFARKKLDRLDRYLPGISNVYVELSHQNNKRGEDFNIAQITVRHQRGAILRAEERVSGEMEIAIDQAIDKMHRQIERFKGKRRNSKRHQRFSLSLEELNAAEPALETEEEILEAMGEPVEEAETAIIRRKNVQVTAMTEDEAIEQMELLGHTFFVFYNTNTGAINVLYKRTAGGYGVLLPQIE